MNYYEELGVGPEATEQEIRKAHRRLVKLMHPDAQPDPSLKLVAETQMRRLNSIVSTLLDSEQRRAYDTQLRVAQNPQSQLRTGPTWKGIPWWLGSTVGAIVLTLVAVWLWADHLGSSFGRTSRTIYIPSSNPPVAALPPASSSTSTTATSFDRAGSSDQPALITAAPPATEQPASVSTAAGQADPLPAPPPAAKQAPPVATQTIAAVALPQKKKEPTISERPKSPAPTAIAKVEPKHTPVIPPPIETAPEKSPRLLARNVMPLKPALPDPMLEALKPQPARKLFSMPAVLLAKAIPHPAQHSSQIPLPPGVSASTSHEDGNIPSSPLPAAIAPKPAAPPAVVTPVVQTGVNPRDPLEGEWIYAPREPERRRAGFYPPEFIDLRIFSTDDSGNLRGQYSARYLVTDKPVSPDISFQVASVSKGSHRFTWQSGSGAKGTLNVDTLDDNTIRIDWRTTTGIHGPALTSGTATLVRRQ